MRSSALCHARQSAHLYSHCVLILLAVGLLALASPLPAADNLLINEFVADNNGTLLDQFGVASDWIEIYNAGTNTVNLNGWHLTDDKSDLAKWTFPATNLPSGGYLIVFASGTNHAIAGQELHANFSLDQSGEYLGLIRPDGTIAHDYSPQFPQQLPGISYGIEFSANLTTFVTNSTSLKWLVPASAGALPANWMTTAFNDSTWVAGHIGVGFEFLGTNLPSIITTNAARSKPTTQSSTNGFGSELAVDGNVGSFTLTTAGANLPATWEVNLATNYGIERITLWNRSSSQSRLRDITIRILSLNGATTNYTSVLLNPENVLAGSQFNVGPTNLILNLTQETGGLIFGGRVRVTRTPDPDLSGSGGQGSSSEVDVLSLAEVEVMAVPLAGGGTGVYSGLIASDLGSAMFNKNSSAFVRIPFLIPTSEMPIIDQLKLRMKYDDGFVAYLNGVEVARRNAPGAPVWNSAATAIHSNAAPVLFEDIDISPFVSQLQEGNNVLAIQGLNAATTNKTFLIYPELVGQNVNLKPARYFVTPSPGATNGGSALGVVADTKFDVDRGVFDAPFPLTITSATGGALIRYTTNGTLPSAVTGTLYAGPFTVNRTMVIRAIATKPGWLSSDVDTHTFVLVSNVFGQNLSSAFGAGFPATWPGTTPDYDMDPNIVTPNQAAMKASLHALPSVFITASISNLFDAVNGIYVHPTSHGTAWERVASMEMVDTNNHSEFQIDCGLRIQGGAFRGFNFTQKKSFRVLFKGIYGPGKLHHDIFHESEATQDFDCFVLRAGGNDGYAWGAATNTVQFTRDEFGRRLRLDMGHPSPRGIFVHVYLNGLYWGLYNLLERPNEDFSSAYLGGQPDDWDSITSKGNIKLGDFNAWNSLSNQMIAISSYGDYQKLSGKNTDGSRNPAYPVLYDKLNYMDYFLLNTWGGNWDWPANNFWMGRKRTDDSGGFKFYMWDFENTLGNNGARSPLDAVSPRQGGGNEYQWVGAPHYFMKTFGEYKMDFADRVQKYFFNGGLLDPRSLTNRFKAISDFIQPAILAETARWGDDNHSPAYTVADWTWERDWILTNYLPQRTDIVLQQLRADGVFPAIAAPSFSQFGGAVPAAYALTITHTNATGTIFFTLDGTDPRVPGAGTVAAGAQAYSTAIIINNPAQVRARVLSGTDWSALIDATFFPPQDLSKLSLTEIMYHAPNVGATNGDEFDFIELKNTGTNALNLSGLTFTNGVSFTFTNGTTLGAGQFFVLARNPAAMAAKYPGLPVKGIFSGKLDNGGETLTLQHPLGQIIFSVNYDDEPPWPVAADGLGFSLVPKNPGFTQAADDGTKWRASANIGGSPGADDPTPNIPAIVISEILTHTDLPQVDAIELYNPTDNDVDVGGWYLTDDAAVWKKYRIPNNTIIPSGTYRAFDEAQFNATPGATNCFALSSVGDDCYLYSATTGGQLTGYAYGVVFGASFNGVSFGRYVDSAGAESFPSRVSVTLGQPNSGPRVGPVVINEINYHPGPGGDEFIELLNVTANPVPFFDVNQPNNTWKVSGLGYTFPTNITLGANQLLLLVATNPASFRAKYTVPAPVQILGPYSGALQDSGEKLELQVPDNPNTNGVPYVTIEEIRYNDKVPWPAAADGNGPSLQRIAPGAFGNDPINWTAATPTPGLSYGVSDTDGDGMPDLWETENGTLWYVPDANEDPDHDGMSNLQEYLAGTHPNDPGSSLKVLRSSRVINAFTLDFMAMSNRTYSVVFKATLTPGAWTKLSDIASQPQTRMVTVTNNAVPAGTRFYRIVTPALP